jgi:hypothetical protein
MRVGTSVTTTVSVCYEYAIPAQLAPPPTRLELPLHALAMKLPPLANRTRYISLAKPVHEFRPTCGLTNAANTAIVSDVIAIYAEIR